MHKFLIVILSLIMPLAVIATEGFSSLEEQMSGKEYMSAGLYKLTPEELEALNNWIRSHSVATLDKSKSGSYAVAASAEGNERSFKKNEDSDTNRSPFTTRIKGGFSGWDGFTVFVLENGTIWEQADTEEFSTPEVQNPEVTIEPGIFGTWRLSVDGYYSRCRVKQVQ